jgi:hypothetical protein
VSTASAWPRPIRSGLFLALAALAGFVLWFFCVDLSRPVEIDMGPGARGYVLGMSEGWSFDGAMSWRSLQTRSRVTLPLVLSGPGALVLTLRSKGESPSEVRAELDDVSLGTRSLTPGFEPRELRFSIPDGRRRAAVRLRAEVGAESHVEIARLRWEAASVAPSRNAWLGFGVFLVLTVLALVIAGLGPRATLAATLAAALAMSAVALADGFAGLHLASRLAPAALVGASVLLLSRLLAPRSSVLLRALFLAAVIFRSALLFHPRFYFVDYPIHETLLELVYHRGMVDFWERLPDYQKIHNLGVAPVAGEYRAFPYPVAFYFLAGAFNRLHHAPELWLKLTAAGLSALALFPLGSLARGFSDRPRADAFAAAAFLLVPSITRSLLLYELSAVLGSFFDLLALACLARLCLNLEGVPRFSLAAAAMTGALVAYTAAFIHFGLFVGAALALGIVRRSLDGRNLARLAGAGLLAAALALIAYHPDTVRALPDALLAGADGPEAAGASLSERAESVLARAHGFLGIPLVGLGAFGLVLALRKLECAALKLLFEAWALSALAALGLRVLFPDLFHYAKELYWGGAVLSVGAGSLLAGEWVNSRRGRLFAVVAIGTLALAYALSLERMVRQFYTHYLFL